MRASINFSRLARKLLRRHLAQQKKRAEYQESRALGYERQERAHRRLRNLTTKVLVHDMKKRSRKAQFNFARLARLMLQKSYHKNRRKSNRAINAPRGSPSKEDQWRKMYLQLHHSKTEAVIKKHEKRPDKLTSHLSPTGRWELLTAYIVTKKKPQKSSESIQKWKRLVIKLMQSAEDS